MHQEIECIAAVVLAAQSETVSAPADPCCQVTILGPIADQRSDFRYVMADDRCQVTVIEPAIATQQSGFREELESLINCHSMENGSDTPDFILADYLLDCLKAFDKASNRRHEWHGHPAFLGD